MATVLQLIKVYKGNAPLLNNMVKTDGEFRTLACYLSGESDGNNAMEQRAARTVYCQFPSKRMRWTNPKVLKAVAGIIDREQVDLVVCQFRRTIPIGVLAAKLSRRRPKVMAVLHGIVGGKVGPGLKLLNYFAFKGLERIVSVSRNGVDDIVRMNLALPWNKVTAIPNGLDCAPFLGPPQAERGEVLPDINHGDFVFAMVGRLAEVKNHARVLRALARLRSSYPNARLVVVGKGPGEQVLKSQTETLGLAEQVCFLGFRRDVPEILKHCDAYLMPSLREGFGLALAEAMAAGLPVITSDTGGMAELVANDDYGYRVDPYSVDEIARAMQQVLDSPAENNRALGERARQRIRQHFDATSMAERYQSLYREILCN